MEKSFINEKVININELEILYYRFGGHLDGLWCKYVPDIFFFSVLLFFGTFILATKLKQFKLSPFLPTKVYLWKVIQEEMPYQNSRTIT